MRQTQAVDAQWLEELFVDAGLEPDEARAASREAIRRLLAGPVSGERPETSASSSGIRAALVSDPAASVSRILTAGYLGLPFHDPDTGGLSVALVADVLADVGLDPVVAMAYARVVVEVAEPERFYAPIWRALGQEGPLDLRRMADLDFEALREPTPIEVTTVDATVADLPAARKEPFKDTLPSVPASERPASSPGRVGSAPERPSAETSRTGIGRTSTFLPSPRGAGPPAAGPTGAPRSSDGARRPLVRRPSTQPPVSPRGPKSKG